MSDKELIEKVQKNLEILNNSCNKLAFVLKEIDSVLERQTENKRYSKKRNR